MTKQTTNLMAKPVNNIVKKIKNQLAKDSIKRTRKV